MKEILNFEDNGKEYCLYYDKSLKYACRKADKLSFDVTEEEKNFIFFVLLKVLPLNDLKYLGNVQLKNNSYNHYIDKLNNYHLFLDSNRHLPTFADFKSLNIIYNNQKDYVASDKEKKLEDKAKITRVVSVKGKKIVVGLLLSVGLYASVLVALSKTSLGRDLIIDILEKDIVSEYDLAYDTLEVNDIEEALKNNVNLSLEEKEYLTSFTDFFNDMLPYLDYTDVMDSLSKMSIVYQENAGIGVTGAWHHVGNNMYEMQIYNSKEINEDNKKVIRHEFMHVFSAKTALISLGLDESFYEFLNRTITNEYDVPVVSSKGYDHGYFYLDEIGNMSLELFSSETLKKYHANPSLDLLTQELMTIIPDEQMAYSFFNDFNDYVIACKGFYNHSPELAKEKSLAEWQQEKDTLTLKLKETLKNYWEVKYNKKIDSDLYVYYLYDRESAIKEIMEQNLIPNCPLEVLEQSSISMFKPYVNERLKDNFEFQLSLPNVDGVNAVFTIMENNESRENTK